MDRQAEGVGAGALRLGLRAPLSDRPYHIVLASFVGLYGLVGAMLALGLAGAPAAYVEGLILLVLLASAVFLGSLLEGRRTEQRFYLALSMIPGLTIARLAFEGLTVSILDPLFTYLLLAGTLLVLRPTIGATLGVRGSRRHRLLIALPLGGGLAAAFAILGLVVPLQGGPAPSAPTWFLVFILAPVALLDEFWFRGILQGELAGATSASWGWLATAGIFAAYGAPFATPSTFLFRLGYGVVLGTLAIHRENVPAVMVARTAMVVALVALSPALASTSILV